MEELNQYRYRYNLYTNLESEIVESINNPDELTIELALQGAKVKIVDTSSSQYDDEGDDDDIATEKVLGSYELDEAKCHARVVFNCLDTLVYYHDFNNFKISTLNLIKVLPTKALKSKGVHFFIYTADEKYKKLSKKISAEIASTLVLLFAYNDLKIDCMDFEVSTDYEYISIDNIHQKKKKNKKH
jgi:hypothetical protein